MKAKARLNKHRKPREITNSQQESSMKTTNQKWTQVTEFGKGEKEEETGREKRVKQTL